MRRESIELRRHLCSRTVHQLLFRLTGLWSDFKGNWLLDVFGFARA